MATSNPLTLSGVGVREKIFQVLLNQFDGTPASLAVLISLTFFMTTIVWGMLGGIIYLFYRSSQENS